MPEPIDPASLPGFRENLFEQFELLLEQWRPQWLRAIVAMDGTTPTNEDMKRLLRPVYGSGAAFGAVFMQAWSAENDSPRRD